MRSVVGRRIPAPRVAPRGSSQPARSTTELGPGGGHRATGEFGERCRSQPTDTGGEECRCPLERLAGIGERGDQDPDVGRQRVEDPVASFEPIERDPRVVVEPFGDGVVVGVVGRAEGRPEGIDVLVAVSTEVRLDADELGRSNAVSNELHRGEDPRRPAVAVVERMDGDDVEMEQRRANERRCSVRAPAATRSARP